MSERIHHCAGLWEVGGHEDDVGAHAVESGMRKVVVRGDVPTHEEEHVCVGGNKKHECERGWAKLSAAVYQHTLGCHSFRDTAFCTAQVSRIVAYLPTSPYLPPASSDMRIVIYCGFLRSDNPKLLSATL